jgi:DNA modification methylase
VLAPAPARSAWRNRIVGHGDEDPSLLVANPRNWRLHPKHQSDALAGVLAEVGWVQEVTVNQRSGFVVDGHLRVALAASRHELAVPVRYVDLDDAEEALILATLDPIGALATADSDTLSALLAGLEPADEAVRNLLRDLAPPRQKQLNPDDADLTPPDEPITQPGDLWLLGDHRLLCGDALNFEDVQRLLDGRRADMVMTDPPYGIRLDTDYSKITGSRNSMVVARGGRRVIANTYRAIEGDSEPFDASALSAQFSDVSEQFWFGANYYRRTLPGSDLDGSWLVWDKRPSAWNEGGEGIDDVIGAGFELIWSRNKHQQRMLRIQWSGFTARNPNLQRSHPTEKPVQLLAELIERWSSRSAVVADVFAGSGTTLIAAEQLDRQCYAMEIDPAYCDVIVRRWERVSGRQAQQTHP